MPRIVTFGALTRRPFPGADSPSISIFRTVSSPSPTACVFAEEPGCV
jgi:hypothetical protein